MIGEYQITYLFLYWEELLLAFTEEGKHGMMGSCDAKKNTLNQYLRKEKKKKKKKLTEKVKKNDYLLF
jgi:hypothetical protein